MSLMQNDGKIVLTQDADGDWLLPEALGEVTALVYGGAQLHHLVDARDPYGRPFCGTQSNGRPERTRGLFTRPTLKLCKHCRDQALKRAEEGS